MNEDPKDRDSIEPAPVEGRLPSLLLDEEGGKAPRGGPIEYWVTSIISLAWVCFHLWTTWNGELPMFQHLSVVLGFAYSLVFIWNPISRRKDGRRPLWALLLDGTLWLIGLLTASYLAINFQAIAANPGFWSPLQIAVCIAAIVLCVEGARRCIGWALPIFAIVAIAYAFYRWPLGIFTHSPFTSTHILTSIVFTRQGIFASPMAVIGTFLSVFMIFAAVLQVSGIGKFFIELARAAFGHRRGGAPKVALISSALHGSVSGAGVATTATTGAFTIPLMIRMGLEKQRAAAFEAAAGIGGAFLPPIMGAAAFIIASFLGVPYLAVITAALIPALLYYWTLYWVIDIEATRLNLPRERKDTLPKIGAVLKARGFQLLPIIVLVWALTAGATPGRAGLFGVGAAVIVSFFYKDTRLNLTRVIEIARTTAKMLVTLVVAVTCVGVVISVLSFTGLGLRLSGILLDLAGGSLLLLVILTAIASIVLGAGLPATPVYLVLAVLVAPALIEFGVPPLAAHLFIFYFGVLGDMTPPLAISPMVAAGIAGSDPLKTTFTVMRVGLAGWLIPFWFVFHSGLILEGNLWEISTAIIGAAIGLFLVAVALQRYYRRRIGWLELALVVLGVFALIFPNLWLNLFGILVAAWIVISQRRVQSPSDAEFVGTAA